MVITSEAVAVAAALRRRAPILLLALLSGCGGSPPPVRENFIVFGSAAQIEIRAVPQARAQRALADISAQLTRDHRDWHAWEPSALTAINAAFAHGRAAPAGADIIAMLRRSQALSELSDGLFDPAIGALVARWGFHTSHYPVRTPAPSAVQLDAWRATRPRVTQVSIEGNRLRSSNRAVQLDFGAIAEGMAVQQTVAILARHGIDNALIDLGGDVYARGRADGRDWNVGLRDPLGANPEAILAGVRLRDGEALFTSGGYSKYRIGADGARWPHVLDPVTGLPARGTATVVVLTRDPLLADAAATALFVGGAARFAELVRRMDLHCALLLTDRDALWLTAAMQRRLRLLRQPATIHPALDRGATCTPDSTAAAPAHMPAGNEARPAARPAVSPQRR